MYTPPPGVLGICMIVKDLQVAWRVSVHNKGHVRKRMGEQEQADGDRR